MRIRSIRAENFGSYDNLEFSFDKQGLTLISGPTGAGKSTIMDIVAWGLFGITAKGGTVDEVRRWNATEPTTVTIWLQDVTISRTRGKVNDLSYWPADGVVTRGKDLTDTQKLINQQIGFTAETFLASAYFHEFSQTASFFTTTAKIRRQITEQIVDLTLAKSLTEKLAAYKKDLKTEKDELINAAALLKDRCVRANMAIKSEEARALHWRKDRDAKLLSLKERSISFEVDKREAINAINKDYIKQTVTLQSDIVDLENTIQTDAYYENKKTSIINRIADLGDAKCETCGSLKNQDTRMVLTKELYDLEREVDKNKQNRVQLTRLNQQLEKTINSLAPRVNAEENRTNTYLEQIEELNKASNPHNLDALYTDLTAQTELQSKNTTALEDVSLALDDAEMLSDVTQEFRGACITNAVSFIETETNQLLTKHFDAELRVEFKVEDADKLDVTIYKDGNMCTYTQLSKGQRQLLKLTFGVSVMKCVANNNGNTPSCLMIDEPTEGCDESLKLKSFNLLQELATEYDSVLVIDHNEALKAMFTRRYEVSLNNGTSTIEEV